MVPSLQPGPGLLALAQSAPGRRRRLRSEGIMCRAGSRTPSPSQPFRLGVKLVQPDLAAEVTGLKFRVAT
jgi:hypothetical protein